MWLHELESRRFSISAHRRTYALWVIARVIAPGQVVLAFSMAGLGILSLIYRDYAMDWQPVPAWVPWRPVLASASGALLLLSGIGLLLRRFATTSALILSAFML